MIGVRQLHETLLVLLGLGWGIAVATGLCALVKYQTDAGPVGNPALHWPIGSRLVHVKGRAHLVMVAHPHCPCTRASIEALARIMAHAQDRISASVLFLKPSGVPEGWEQTDLWHRANAIPGVVTICDDRGEGAGIFGVASSGHVLLYDGEGRRIFSGGITAGRGHQGDNAGLALCIGFINGKVRVPRDMPVFGCLLLDPSAAEEEGVGLCRNIR